MTSSSPPRARPFPHSLRGVLLRPGLWPLLLRSVTELARARRVLGTRQVRDMIGERGVARLETGGAYADTLVAQVAWAIPRVAARVPWRSDCLVQAMAARRWLASRGIATDLHIGVRRDRAPGFEAHAWLTQGTTIVTGGDVSGYEPLLSPGA